MLCWAGTGSLGRHRTNASMREETPISTLYAALSEVCTTPSSSALPGAVMHQIRVLGAVP